MAAKVILISGPSGSGKTTIVKKLREHFGNKINYSISFTTRKPRKNELNGENYFFLTTAEFKKKIANNEFVEWAIYNNCYYGTSKKTIIDSLLKGINIILEIEVVGAKIILDKFKNECLSIFIVTKNLNKLQQRLKYRNDLSMEQINSRLQIAESEISQKSLYDFVINNDGSIANTITKIIKIIEKEWTF